MPNMADAAARRIARGTDPSRRHWRRVILKNPLIAEAQEHQRKFTSAGTPRLRSREFKMKSFGQDLSAVAMRAIKTNQFVDRDLVQCLTLLAVSKRVRQVSGHSGAEAELSGGAAPRRSG